MRDDPDDWDYRGGLERNAYIHVIPRIEMIQRMAVLILLTNFRTFSTSFKGRDLFI